MYTQAELVRELNKTPEQRDAERLETINALHSHGLATLDEERERRQILRRQIVRLVEERKKL